MTMLGNQFVCIQNSVSDDSMYHPPSGYSKTKQQLASTFSKAAKQYHQKAQVQQRIANQLLKRMAANGIDKSPSTWLDLGCGSGYLLNQLCERDKANRYIGLDIAHGMLLEAQQTKQSSFLNADAESIPLRSNSVDHVVSSMALQWVSTPKRVMSEIARILCVNGKASLAILRDDSLPELHQGWQQLGQGSRVNQFASRSDWHKGIQEAGLIVEGIEKQSFQTQHKNLFYLLYSIKGIGAGTTVNKTTKPLRRADLRNLERWWHEQHQIDNSLILTYTVDFWQLTV